MADKITDLKFHDDDAARAHLEAVRWPNGANCPHCGSVNVLRMTGKAHRVGAWNCRDCRKQFSVTVGTVFERSHLPLHKWVLATHLLTASKKGISAHQLSRMLGTTYKTAWFMAHRIREAMTETNSAPMGGEGKVIEADEVYHGKRETPVLSASRKGKPYLKRDLSKQKRSVLALVERGGQVRAKHVNFADKHAVRDMLLMNADRASRLHTDESKLYVEAGKEYANHETVNHAAREYARDDVTTNTIEGFFGLFKRGMKGIYQHCGEQHFQRYINEFAFRYNHRVKLGVNDTDRALIALRGISTLR